MDVIALILQRMYVPYNVQTSRERSIADNTAKSGELISHLKQQK